MCLGFRGWGFGDGESIFGIGILGDGILWLPDVPCPNLLKKWHTTSVDPNNNFEWLYSEHWQQSLHYKQ